MIDSPLCPATVFHTYLSGQESMAWGLDAIAALYTLSSLTLVLCLTALGKNKGLNDLSSGQTSLTDPKKKNKKQKTIEIENLSNQTETAFRKEYI